MTYRQILRLADLANRKAVREGRLMTLGKLRLPGTVRPTQAGWAAITTMTRTA